MTIKVKFFASLADKVKIDETEMDFKKNLTINHVWDIATNKLEKPSNILCSRNLEHCHLTDAVKDGDEVAFFPPVTGG